MRNGPQELLHSLTELRPGDAKRRYRKSIFEDFPTRGPFNQCACAYCGKWNEKLTIDHVVPKSKGGPHFAKWNNVPSCLSCNASKGSMPLFEWWRPQLFWTPEREEVLMSWIYAHSFISAHTDLGEWEDWCESHRFTSAVHGPTQELFRKEKGACCPLFAITLCSA